MQKRENLFVLALAGAAGAWLYSRTDRGARVASDAVERASNAATAVGIAIVRALTPRGIRNNNPGNIRWIDDPVRRWRGMVSQDAAGYGVFDTAANGVRAIGGELRASMRRGVNSVWGLISEWAPSTENDTVAYASDVAAELGVDLDEPLGADRVAELAAAIIKHENGTQPYAPSSIVEWVQS
jgi:hypothetical protein